MEKGIFLKLQPSQCIEALLNHTSDSAVRYGESAVLLG